MAPTTEIKEKSQVKSTGKTKRSLLVHIAVAVLELKYTTEY